MTEKKLTEKEQIFCIEYCTNGFNATKAALTAGYSEKSAKEIGCQNLTKLHIQDKIKELRGNFADLMAKKGITRERTAMEAAKLAYSGIAELHNTWIERKDFEALTDEQKACISEISTQTRKVNIPNVEGEIEVEFVKVKLYDKIKAIEVLNKMMGWNEPEKTDLTSGGDKIQIILSKREADKD